MKKPRERDDEPVKVPVAFDDAIRRVLQVNPPGGWGAVDRDAEAELRRRKTPRPGRSK